MEKVDKDKSGTIDKEEFMAAMDEIYSLPKSSVEEIVEAFQIFDRDNSLTITLDEMKKILMKYSKEFTEETLMETE